MEVTFQANHFLSISMHQLQGSKYDPEGEYVRQWLPELARMPTEWIHHPWDAPGSVLKAAGVELGFNYPKPIIEMDTARQRLTEAICQMQGMAGIALAETNCTNEVVVDNTDNTENTDTNADTIRVDNVENSAIPKTVLHGRPGSISGSSWDQQVPSLQRPNNRPPNGKRPRISEEDRAPEANPNYCNENNRDGLRTDEDLCSTADSSPAKKPTTSINSFCVPQACSVTTHGKGLLDSESSDVKQPWKEPGDIE